VTIALKFKVGEKVTFNWGGNGHNVVEVNSKKDFDDCSGFDVSDEGESGPVTVSFDKVLCHHDHDDHDDDGDDDDDDKHTNRSSVCVFDGNL